VTKKSKAIESHLENSIQRVQDFWPT